VNIPKPQHFCIRSFFTLEAVVKVKAVHRASQGTVIVDLELVKHLYGPQIPKENLIGVRYRTDMPAVNNSSPYLGLSDEEILHIQLCP